VPTFERGPAFLRDLRGLNRAQRLAVRAALADFIADADSDVFRPSLRVKRFQSRRGVWEMTWAGDGRALFEYGEPVRPGQPHIVWLRIGSHEIFE
jgi:hypothetical protein